MIYYLIKRLYRIAFNGTIIDDKCITKITAGYQQ